MSTKNGEVFGTGRNVPKIETNGKMERVQVRCMGNDAGCA
jgi:hypothetical protein